MTLNYRLSFVTGIVLTSLLVIINALPNHGLVYPQLINSGHAFVFFCANLFLLKLLLGHAQAPKKILFISLFSILIGLLIEYIQPYFGRNRSILDFYYDIIGVLFSAIFYIRINTNRRKSASFLLILFFCLSIALPVFRMYLWWQINHSPTLLNFDRDWEKYIYSFDSGVKFEKISASHLLKTTGQAGKFEFDISDTYIGVSLDYPKADWRAYRKLSWKVFSEHQQAFYMSLRIHDSKHNQEYSDRFNYRFKVSPGYNMFEVSFNDIQTSPTSRSMEMDKIQSVKFFLTKPDRVTSLYLDNIELK